MDSLALFAHGQLGRPEPAATAESAAERLGDGLQVLSLLATADFTDAQRGAALSLAENIQHAGFQPYLVVVPGDRQRFRPAPKCAGSSARGSGSRRPSSSYRRSRVRRSRHHRRRPARRRRPAAPAPLVPSRRPLEVPDPPRTDVTVCDTSRRCPAMWKSQGGRLPRPGALPGGAVRVSRFSPDTPQRPTGIKTPGPSRSRERRSPASLLPKDSPEPVLARSVTGARARPHKN
ncbi:UNVERIFIED_CONTAM: hypothetical protein RKD50_007266 [Streptomyces canus]